MDKNQAIGLTLISLLFITYFQFFAPRPAVKPPQVKEQLSTRNEGQPPAKAYEADTPERVAAWAEKYGIFAGVVSGKEKELVLENEVMKVTLTSQGGRVKEVLLKNYKTHDQQPLVLLDEHSSKMGFDFTANNIKINTNELFFEINDHNKNVSEGDVAHVTFTLSIAPDKYIQQTFSMPGNRYELGYQVKVVGLAPYLDEKVVNFVWNDRVKRVEKDLKESRNKTTVNYYLAKGSFDYLNEYSDTKEEKTLHDPIKWVSVKQKFFTVGIIAETPFKGGYITAVPTLPDSTSVKLATMRLAVPLETLAQEPGKFTFYFGPNNYQILKKVTEGFSNNVSLGWPIIKWINQFLIIPIFNFLEKYISNYGVIIFLLVIIIKILLMPLSYKSYMAMAEMKALKPALDEIKAKHKDDLHKIQLEQMTLYREMGISPLSGCIPVLLQIPILLAMFNFFPNSIELRQEPFLWAKDLSTYDSILNLPYTIPWYGSHVSLFTLLMTASTILYTWSNNQVSAAQGPMKTMSYIMPIMFMFVVNTLPAGLSFYYFVSNLVTFGQQALIKKFVDEAKINKKLEENRKKNKNKKKSRFQLRLEQAMKAAEERKRK
ncbi:MAG: membrane protein insertase YidC [Cytophagales bacterium]|nr:membrane protein insertase YidC [Cytophagales bacterium]